MDILMKEKNTTVEDMTDQLISAAYAAAEDKKKGKPKERSK